MITLEAYPLYISYILIIVGFFALILGADWLVNGASGLAKRFNVPDLVIGLTVVAFGTSAPELVVNLVAAIKGSSEIALTNILGSNIINTLVILGVSALIYPVASQRSSRRNDIPLSILAGFLVLLLVLINPNNGGLNHWSGIVLLLFFASSIFASTSFTTAVQDSTIAVKGRGSISKSTLPASTKSPSLKLIFCK